MSKLTSSEVNKYGFYAFTSALATMIPMSYITIFITDNLLISASLMGATLLVARIIDFVISLVAGGVIEKSKLKWGKYRSWTKIMRFTVFAGCALQFLDTTSYSLIIRIIIVSLGYILLNGSMNFIATAQFGIMACMAGTSLEERNRLSIRSAQWMAAGTIIISASALPLIQFLTPYVGNTNGYFIAAVFFAAFFLIGATVLVKVSEPYDKPVPKDFISNMPAVTVNDMIKSVVTNNQLLIVIFSNTIFNTGMFIFNGVMAYYFMYVLGNYLLMSVAMTSTTVFGLVASIFGPQIGKKLGKKNAMVAGLLLYSAGSLSIALFGKISLIVYIVINCIMVLGMYFFMGFGPNYMLDAGEYGLYKTGKDNRAVAMSMMNIPMKIGMALGGAIAGFGLSFIGYEAGMAVDASFINSFMWLMGGLPSAFYLLGALVMFIGYKITDADAAKYAAENAERMAEFMQQS